MENTRPKNFLESVDERTGLAGANKLELLLFGMGSEHGETKAEVFAINVFKVREVVHVPEITRVPSSPEWVDGMVSLRGQIVPVINLARYYGINTANPQTILIVAEYNGQIQGLLVHNVENIIRLEWDQITAPPSMLAEGSRGSLITSITRLKDGRLAMVLDVEKVLADTARIDEQMERDLDLPEPSGLDSSASVFFADDSPVARKQIERVLMKLGVRFNFAQNGAEAWTNLCSMANEAQQAGRPLKNTVRAILTDVEMPEMDGYVLTKHIKGDPRFNGIPVIMHSSLSANTNQAIGKSVGVDHYVSKFQPRDLFDVLKPYLAQEKHND